MSCLLCWTPLDTVPISKNNRHNFDLDFFINQVISCWWVELSIVVIDPGFLKDTSAYRRDEFCKPLGNGGVQ